MTVQGKVNLLHDFTFFVDFWVKLHLNFSFDGGAMA